MVLMDCSKAGVYNMNFKKRVNGSWHDIPHYIHNTSTDTITTLPADLYADGNNATVGLKGNTIQNGTSTPDNPIMPQGTGNRTANLFDYQTGTPTAYKCLDENGTEIGVSESAPWYITDYIPIPDGVLSVTLSKIGGGVPAMCAYDASKNYIAGIKYDTGSAVTKVDITLTSSTPIRFIRFSYFLGNMGYDDMSTKMLNAGSTALPYEPYGYKIPILSASTTTPVYLGEVETTRRVKKYEFTGEENWIRETGNTYVLEDGVEQTATDYANALCTHYVLATSYSTLTGTDGTFSVSKRPALFIHDENFTTAAQLKTYLATQYANGTPVVIYCTLNTPETAVVNEPLMKIDNYADTVSGITISTITGKDTFDVLTTLKPSEVELTYTGWHDAEVKEWDGSQWNE